MEGVNLCCATLSHTFNILVRMSRRVGTPAYGDKLVRVPGSGLERPVLVGTARWRGSVGMGAVRGLGREFGWSAY